MSFANALPWWGLIAAVAAAAFLAWSAYAPPRVSLPPARRFILTGLRLATFLALLLVVMRPVRIVPAAAPREAVVPVLVDTSRSMQIPDADGAPRLDRARDVVTGDLLPALQRDFKVEVLGFGERLAAVDPQNLSAEGRRSDLGDALEAVRQRYRGRQIAGIVVVSDGGDTGGRESAAAGGPPVYAIGIGSPTVRRDREVQSVTAGDASVAGSSVDVTVSMVSHGLSDTPVEVRLLENGRVAQTRVVRPAVDGSPTREVFQVAPGRDAATLYTVEIAADPREVVSGNNSRSVLIEPPGRTRRILLVEGAPGFEHSFLKRALAADPGLEVDAVVRKGENDRGQDTYYVQAVEGRTGALATGYPDTRASLFAYDAIVLGNVEADFIGREQLAMTAAFVDERGGGLLVLGALSFTRGGLVGTPVERLLPVDLADRGVAYASSRAGEALRIALTSEGERHPVMQLGASAEETRQRWGAAPALSSSAPIGRPRPGATVLAVARDGGAPRPIVAVQRYGHGRSMIFSGEASWRWRMLLPSSDRTHERFWRQAVRWLATAAPDPVAMTAARDAVPGSHVPVEVTVRDAAFAPSADAAVRVRVSGPGGASRDVQMARGSGEGGRFSATFKAENAGVYRVKAEAVRGHEALGAAETWVLVGGADTELADPRLNEGVLRRLALSSGGRYLAPREARTVASLLRVRARALAPPAMRDLWHNAWVFGILATLACAEWTLRRRWGLR